MSDDEFGDFEEAQFVDEKVIDEIVESQGCASAVEPQESLQSLLNIRALWDLGDENENVELEVEEQSIFDSFHGFSKRFDFPSDVESASDVWSELRIGEGVSALQFQWSTSKSCVLFVNALPLHLIRNDNRSEYKFEETPDEEQQYVSLQSLSATKEYDLGKSDSTMNVEALNGSASTIDYKFFESGTHVNAQSLVEQELGALGLADTRSHYSKPATSPTTNGVGNRGTAENPQKALHQPRYLCVSELNQEAQSFYEQMPDLHFMLANRIIRER